MTLRTEQIRTCDQIRASLEGNDSVEIHLADRDAYTFISRTLIRFGYHGRGRVGKGLLRRAK